MICTVGVIIYGGNWEMGIRKQCPLYPLYVIKLTGKLLEQVIIFQSVFHLLLDFGFVYSIFFATDAHAKSETIVGAKYYQTQADSIFYY